MNQTQPLARLRSSYQLLRERAAHRLRGVSFWTVILLYLTALTLAEIITTWTDARLGMMLHGVLLLAVFFLATIYPEGPQSAFLYAMALAPLIRLTSLSLPLGNFPLVFWYGLVGLPLLLAGFFAMRIDHLSRAQVGLRFGNPFMQILIAMSGIVLGAIEYTILKPAPLIQQFSLRQAIFPAFILLIFTGFLEEFVFRGVMQRTGYENFAWRGIIYVSVVFAVLHIGYKSGLDLVFVFCVAMLFAFAAKKTGSILGVTLAHGFTNIGLFLVFPFLLSAQVVNNLQSKIPWQVNLSGLFSPGTTSTPPPTAVFALQPTSLPTAISGILTSPTAIPQFQVASLVPTNTLLPTTAFTLTPSVTVSSTQIATKTSKPVMTVTSTLLVTPSRVLIIGTALPPFPTATGIPPSPQPSPLPTQVKTQEKTPTNTPVNTQANTPIPSPTKLTASATATPKIPHPTNEMTLIPKGIFRMGCDTDRPYEKCQPDELPLHSVTLDAFLIDRYEVTNAQYADCVATGACRKPLMLSSATHPDYYSNPLYANYPVIYVNWWDANAYCIWAGKRLPNEAEWEKAARLSKETWIYPWGNKPAKCTLGNFSAPGDYKLCVGDTSSVGSYPDGANQADLMDMAGNVAEWVFDWYSPTFYIRSIAANPIGPTDGILRVVRGGSWNSPVEDVRTAARDSLDPSQASSSVGFRCAQTP